LPAICDESERALRVGEERAPCVGQPHPARAAHEELDAQIALECLEPRGQRRLREEERLRGATDVAGARHLDERLEVREEQRFRHITEVYSPHQN